MPRPEEKPMKTKEAIKVGDWVVFDYEIGQVTEMDGDRVTEIKDGMFCRCGRDLTCFPLTLLRKNIAENFESVRKRIDSEAGSLNLNWPELHGYMCELAAEGYELAGDPELPKNGLESVFARLKEFESRTLDAVRGSRATTVEGIRLFR